ncbi:hypothetical protein GVN20_05705 [Runella sp. CRIBMP]|uniref:hypothetical protein n=1 Tax=Runella sp. CRIBMP TaxID=2683261 RepID=UPI001412B4C3|nr:hypothetical protein [Runella sp. CRIBMP]NBB18845.1 hypothetical protein [Runella sp. CRIBMP]
MATILVTPLPDVAFSKNRVFATFQTDSIFATEGGAAVNKIVLSGTIFFNRRITIKYGSVTQEFVCTGPSFPSTGNNIPSGAGDLAHAQAMLPYFQANFYLNRDFTMSVPVDPLNPRIVFVGKAKGPAYNMVPTIYTNIEISVVTAGSVAEKKKNLALAVELQVYNPALTVFENIYAERIPYRGTQIKLNIAELLHPELKPDFPPFWSITVPWKHTKSLKKYRLRTAEGYGDTFALQPQETHPEAYVHFGGTGFRQGLSKTPEEWVQGLTEADDHFLRLGPTLRYLQVDEPQWLNFLNTRADIAELEVQIRIEYADDEIVTVTRDAGALDVNECVSIPVWITALGLHTVDITKGIKSYYVRLLGDGDPVTEEVRYVMDYAYREHKQYFVYLNSVGGWDSFLAYGKSSYGVGWTNQQIQQPIPATYTTNDANVSDVGSVMVDTFTVSTSFYGSEQLRFLRDFFNSPYKFRWDAGVCLPISIKGRDLDEGADGQNQFKHDFQYQYAFENESYDQ